MSAHNLYLNDSSHTLTPHEDYKASYDNLIDDFAKPFAADSNHQTFAVEAPSHRRGISTSLNKSIPSQSDDTLYEAPNVSYPPLPVKDVEPESIWHRVS